MNTEKCENLEYAPHGRTTWPIMGVPRRVRVKGMAGVEASVVVTVVHDTVWLSISPPFTWEAIMKPGKVDEIISMLEMARDEAKNVATARNGSTLRADEAVAQAITRNNSATR